MAVRCEGSSLCLDEASASGDDVYDASPDSIPSELRRPFTEAEPVLSEDELQRLDDIAAEFELDRLKSMHVLRELEPSADISNFRKLSTKMVQSWRLQPAPSGKVRLS